MNGLLRALTGLALYTALPSAIAQDETVTLQQRAIQRFRDCYQRMVQDGESVPKLAPELNRAAKELSQTVEEFTRSGNNAGIALSLIYLGKISRAQYSAKAPEFFRQALSFAKKAENPQTETQALVELGEQELAAKDFAAATKHLHEAQGIAAKLPDPIQLFKALKGLAQVHRTMGDLPGASDLLSRAIALAPKLKDQSLLIYVYIDRSDIHCRLANESQRKQSFALAQDTLELALADYEAALVIARRLKITGQVRIIEHMKQTTEERHALLEKDKTVYSPLADSRALSPKKPEDVDVTEEFASSRRTPDTKLLAKRQRDEESLANAEQESGIHIEDAQAAYWRGIEHDSRGESDAALAAYLKAVELLETDRRNVHDEESQEKFFNDKIFFYYPAITALLHRKRFEEAFVIMEQSRSRVMADLIFSRKLALTQPNEHKLFADAQRLRAEIAALQKKLLDYSTRVEDDSSTAGSQTKMQIAQLEKDQKTLAKTIEKDAPHLRELTASQSASLDRVQEMLRDDGSEMLYYLCLDDKLILWHIAGDTQHARNVFLPRRELKKKVAALRVSIANSDATFDQKTARELFLYLVQPALGWIKSRHVILVRHAELHELPFAALVAPSGKSLGEMFGLSDAPNAGLLLHLEQGDPIGKGRLFAAADPDIEEARNEVEAVAASYPDRNKTTTDSLVAESEVKAVAGQYDVVHLSVHGKFIPLEPMLSYLQLSQDDHDDGHLTAAEMFGLSLGKARLVVFSACESGESEATPGNELLGMERALLYAGAKHLLLSQWSVDAASTALWMKTFHQEAQTKPLAEAARLALIETKKKYPQPYYWASFRLIGR